MSTTTFKIDDRMERQLEHLRVAFGAATKAELFRTAVGMLSLIDRAMAEGKELAFVEPGVKSDGVTRIVIPHAEVNRRPNGSMEPAGA
ncbi:MAG: hypothetical protein ACIAS6_01080 [Phycisphaerales bacterium JB060]